MSSDENVLWRVPKWFPDLSEEVLKKLKAYHSDLIRYNSKVNLIGRQTEREADEQHFSDCISACQIVFKSLGDAKQVYDLGSGNGLPGIVLGILAEDFNPTLEVKLVDSDERKCEFLKQMVFSLKLSKVEVLNTRVEDVQEKIPVAITRGYASVSKVALVCKDVVAQGGQVFHMKGSNWVREVGEMPSQLCAFWAPQLAGEYSLPLSQARRAVVSTQKIK